MSSVRAVPETVEMGRVGDDDLSAEDAWHLLRRVGLRALLTDAFARFRYGDGFSHARAFALQLALATVPLVIAGSGLASAVGAESVAQVVARTVVAVSPGSGDQLLADVVDRTPAPAPEEPGEEPEDGRGEDIGELALGLGLATSFLAMTSAVAQLERGTNRIYGTERDRPALRKYARAALLTVTAGTALGVGLVLIVAGGPFGTALEEVYRWGDAAETVWDVLRWPLGLASLLLAVTLLFRFSPRRRQPSLSWLALGAGLTVVLWLAASGLVALYVALSGDFSATYGPLAGIMALLLVGDGDRCRAALRARGGRTARGRPRRDRRPVAARRRRRRHPRPARARHVPTHCLTRAVSKGVRKTPCAPVACSRCC